jgi:Ca2+-transporting ATPase
LTEREAAERLAREGPNEIPAAGRRDALRIAKDVIAEPMFALLLSAAIIYFSLGDLTEAIALSLFATFSVSIALVQEIRSERVLAALRDLTSPRALVVRDGKQRRIPGREVVRGDLVIVSEGDRVPADAWIVDGHEIDADESLLTGESVPVHKRAAPADPVTAHRPGGDGLPCLFSGTLVVRGHGRAVVTATGALSEIGRIGASLSRIRIEAPRLQSETRRIVRQVAIAGLAVSLAAGVLYGIARESWLDGLLSGIAVGMSMLPEEFPLVLSVFLVMGAWRIAQARVLTRRAASIETLGAVTVLCTDKTGTLTENRMALVHAEAGDQWQPGNRLTPATHHLLEIATLAGLRDPFDPMERALHGVWSEFDRLPGDIFHGRELLEHHGLTSQRLVMTRVWSDPSNGFVLSAAKGAPEAIARLCKLSEADVAAVTQRVSALAARGMRVLAVAVHQDSTPHATAPVSRPFEFLGLLGFEDPVRATVPEAIEECRRAGVRVVMITGDFPATAQAIARQAGIPADDVASGDDLGRMTDEALRARVAACHVFARILPEQKLRIVEALKANGDVVGMTGDGVNDAPSLRAAHIGIAMGGRGTDVAREASSIVLLDDDFGSIIRTIRLGRRIYDNLRKAMGYILAVHVPIAGLALLPLVMGGPLILTPALIALLEMIIDPACSVVFEAEPEEHDIMKRPPRDPKAALLDRALVLSSLAQGALAFVTVAFVFVLASATGNGENDQRTLVLVALVTTNLALILTHRSFGQSIREALARPNALLWYGMAGVTALLFLLLLTPPARDVFRLAPLHGDDLILSVAAATAFVIAAWAVHRPRT